MDQYIGDSIQRLINDSKILILPENSTIDDVLQHEDEHLLGNQNVDEEQAKTVINLLPEENYSDFEQMYQFSKVKVLNLTIREPEDFFYLKPEATSSAERHKPDPEHLLLINRTLKERLVVFHKKIAKLIQKICDQCRVHNLFLEEAKSDETRDSASFKASYVKCGAPFFKDALFVPAPFNEDYKFRKNIAKELFPFDMPKANSRWRTQDKVALVNGVKKQMVEHIKSQKSQQLCQVRKTRCMLQKLKFISKNTDFDDSSMIEIYETIQKNYPDFKINWNIISFSDLHSEHSVSECMGMWYSYLKPDINREPFTEEENSLMAAAFSENYFQDWGYIASLLRNRSSLQTFVHFHTIYSRLCANNVRWSEKEDAHLLELVAKYSINDVVNWGKIGQIMPMRSRLQCYNRHHILSKNQGYMRGRFTSTENRLIMEFVDDLGEENFNRMPKNFLPGRSYNHIKNHYNVTLKHRGAILPWTREEDKILVDYVQTHEKVSWPAIANILQTHNRISCRTRFNTIAKYLEKNPGKTLEDVPIKFKKATVVSKMYKEETEVETKLLPTASASAASFKRYKKQNPELVAMMSTAFNLDFKGHDINVDLQKVKTFLMLLKDENIQRTIDMRKYVFTLEQLVALREIAKVRINENMFKEIRFVTTHTEFRMPPNINTVLGSRAVAIKIHTEEEENALSVENPSENYKEALKAFQELYFKLFYWTAMIQKIDTDDLSLVHFKKDPQSHISTHTIFNKLYSRNSTTSFIRSKRSATGDDAGSVSKIMKMSQ